MILDGTAEVSVDGQGQPVASPSVVLVPARTRHNVRNTGAEPLRYVYVYVTALTLRAGNGIRNASGTPTKG